MYYQIDMYKYEKKNCIVLLCMYSSFKVFLTLTFKLHYKCFKFFCFYFQLKFRY